MIYPGRSQEGFLRRILEPETSQRSGTEQKKRVWEERQAGSTVMADAELEVQISKTLVAASRKGGERGREAPDEAGRTAPLCYGEKSGL